MKTRPDWLKVGALVKGVGFVGRVASIVAQGESLFVTLESAKAVRLHQKWDVLDYNRAPLLWEPATLEDLHADVEQEQQRAIKTLDEIRAWADQVLEKDKSIEKMAA
jgi:hypothetical protein